MQKKLKFAENCKIHTLIKTKNFFAAMCGVIVLAGATIATYTAVTKSQKEMSDLTKQNLEALVQSTREGNEFTKECYDTYSDYSNLGTLVRVRICETCDYKSVYKPRRKSHCL